MIFGFIKFLLSSFNTRKFVQMLNLWIFSALCNSVFHFFYLYLSLPLTPSLFPSLYFSLHKRLLLNCWHFRFISRLWLQGPECLLLGNNWSCNLVLNMSTINMQFCNHNLAGQFVENCFYIFLLCSCSKIRFNWIQLKEKSFFNISKWELWSWSIWRSLSSTRWNCLK